MGISNTTMNQTSGIGCGCSACQNGHGTPTIADQSSYQNNSSNDTLYAAGSNNDPNTFANYLTDGFWEDIGSIGRSWAQNNITFSLNGFSDTNNAGIRKAFDLWDDVANITFTEVSGNADISVIEGNDGRAYSSSSIYANGDTASNTISIDTNVGGWRDLDTLGSYGVLTILHEIGHSLGLGHTGNYNGSATYANDAQWTNDTHQVTIQSYFNATNVGSDHWGRSGQWQYPASPMLIDILAIQNIYGADYTTRNGDTTYGFNSNAGRDQFDFSISEAPVAIWDGGGIDTIDISGYSTNQTIYLTEGDYSSVGYLTNNLVIAYGAEIENAIGGSGHDNFYANDLNNEIDGGAGNDTLTYNYSVSDFVFNVISNTVVSIQNIVQNFTDLISNIENFIFTDGSFTFDQLESETETLENIAIKSIWNNGEYSYISDKVENTTLTATDIGYNNSTTDLITIERSQDQTTITIENTNAPNALRVLGSDSNDIILVNGTHNNFANQIHAGGGDDLVTIQVTGDDRIYANDGNDTINAGAGNDKVYGEAGDDTLNGQAGRDGLFGGAGADTLNGGDDNDWLHGDDGNDTLNGDDGGDTLNGGNGDDILNGGDGFDRLYGGDGNDNFDGGTGNDRIYAGEGNDIAVGGTGQDFIYGDNGDDILSGDESADYLSGDDGDDTLHGGDGNDRLQGGNDDDTLNGDAGSDFLYGQNGHDTINGGTGSDNIDGGTGDDTLYGNEHNDIINGGTGNDIIDGGSHDDVLNGQDGNDLIFGGSGADKLYGGNGLDTLIGGAGVDNLFGGTDTSRDIFGFSATEDSEDRIYNFTYGDDAINITDLLTGYNAGVSDINDFVQVLHAGSRFDVRVDTDGGGDNFVNTARVFTDISNSLTTDDLLNNGTLIIDHSLSI